MFEEVDDISVRSVEEYISQHSSDKDEEVPYCVVLPNETSIYQFFEEIFNLHGYLEKF